MKKINVITLGCSKNTVDSEHLMAQLAAAGYEVRFDSDRTDARTVVINTCGFIGDAKKESIDTILSAVAAKQAGRIDNLFVIGCLSEPTSCARRFPRWINISESGIGPALPLPSARGTVRSLRRSVCSQHPVTTPTSRYPKGATGSADTAPYP